MSNTMAQKRKKNCRSALNKLEKQLSRVLTYLQKGELKKATTICNWVLKRYPEQTDALHLLGLIAKQQGNYERALHYLDRAVAKNPERPEIYYNQGVTLQELGLHARARQSYLKTISIQPDNAEAWDNLGAIYQLSEQLQQAVDAHHKAISSNPDLVSAYNNIGEAYRKLGQYDLAINNYHKALELNPNFIEARTNIGNVFMEQGRSDKALEIFTKSSTISQQPHLPPRDEINSYITGAQYSNSFTHYSQKIFSNTEKATAHWYRALNLLLQGHYNEGWQEYEWGFGNGERSVNNYPYSVWDGSDLSGKTLLVLAEQGIGDEIMFASCIPDIIKQGRHIIFECNLRLAPLFCRSFPDVSIIPRRNNVQQQDLEIFPAIDVLIPAGSLPRFLRNNVNEFPHQRNYLIPGNDRVRIWRNRFSELGDGIKIGISWRGGHKSEAKRKRSTLLQQWQKLFDIKGVHFINLQYGDCTDELDELYRKKNILVHDWDDADPLTDLDDFAAQIAALDLVISVDNTTVHMAGALGVPVWTLLCYAPDWRWLLKGSDTVWYPSMTLIRQPNLDDWSSVFRHAAHKLKNIVMNSEAGTQRDKILKHEQISYKSSAIFKPAVATDLNHYLENNTCASRENMTAVLINDTSAWYHWGCTCTSTAILHHLKIQGLKTSSIPINEVYACCNTPGSLEEFDSVELYQKFIKQNKTLISRISAADIVIINGEGTLHDLSIPSLNLLYIAYVCKLALGKQVYIINHSCYPESQATVSDVLKNALYKKVYNVMDSIAVRESVSADLLEMLGLNVTRSFDCLPLYLEQNNITPSIEHNNNIVVAGSVSLTVDRVAVLVDYMRMMYAQGYTLQVLIGARAYPAQDDAVFIQALSEFDTFDWQLVEAHSADEWLRTIGEARLLVSGRFHHSIAAAFLGTPFIALNSNTPKMDGLMNMLGTHPPIPYAANDLLNIMLMRSFELLEQPTLGLPTEDTLAELRNLSRANFMVIEQRIKDHLEQLRCQ